MKIFAERLKELRKEKGVTQKQLGEATGYNQSMISLWEKDINSPTGEAVVAIADYFNVCTDYLLGRKDFY